MACTKRCINFIGKVRTSVGISSNPLVIKEEIAGYFEDIYQGSGRPRPSLEGIPFPSLSPTSKVWLERCFDEKEVMVALSECEGDKAQGPNGFNFTFIRAARDIIKNEFCEMLSKFHRRERLSKEINATFLALIPKVPHHLEFKEFRPIGLVGLCV